MELQCQRKGKVDAFVKSHIFRGFQRHLRDLGLQILLTSNGTYAPTTFRGLVTLCLPKRKNKEVNPCKVLQTDFELTCFKTVLFIVLLRCLTLGKTRNGCRESKVTHGYLEGICRMSVEDFCLFVKKGSFLFQRRASSCCECLWSGSRMQAEGCSLSRVLCLAQRSVHCFLLA